MLECIALALARRAAGLGQIVPKGELIVKGEASDAAMLLSCGEPYIKRVNGGKTTQLVTDTTTPLEKF